MEIILIMLQKLVLGWQIIKHNQVFYIYICKHEAMCVFHSSIEVLKL